ncbi:MAG TPA: hypothetical protein VFS00_30025, partial [Polyangiaceae bacterium]|nr:hypothetical protein [Polyangiaceae bacterium]
AGAPAPPTPMPRTSSRPASAAPSRRAPTVPLLLLVAVAIAAYASRSPGHFGFGVAHVWAQLTARDEAILAYLPADQSAFLLVGTHHLEPKAFDPEGKPPAPLERLRADVLRVAGVDLALDVDRLALCPGLAVARGRFDRADLAEHLLRAGYRADEYRDAPRWVKPGEDAVALDGSTLLYGDEASLRAAVDARRDEGRSLAARPDLLARLDRAGWSHALVAYLDGAQTTSVRSALLGSTGPRGTVAAFDTTKSGVELHGLVEAASPAATDELLALLEGQRRNLQSMAAGLGPQAGPVLEKAVASATLRKGDDPAFLEAHVRLSAEEVAVLAREASGATDRLRAAYRALRLMQLLAPLAGDGRPYEPGNHPAEERHSLSPHCTIGRCPRMLKRCVPSHSGRPLPSGVWNE